MSRQGGVVLVLVPIILVGLLALGLIMTNQSRTSMRQAGAGLDHVQAKLCMQQCASIAVNAAVVAMEDGSGIPAAAQPCRCGNPGEPAMDCDYTYSSPRDGSRLGCYDLLLNMNQVDLGIRCRDAKGGSVNLEVDVALSEVPIFQFAMFSDQALLLHPGPDMDVPGKVHANDSILLYPLNRLRIGQWVTSPVGVYALKRAVAEPGFAIEFARKQGTGFSPAIPAGRMMKPLEDIIPGWTGWLEEYRVAYGEHSNGCQGVQPLRMPLRGIADPHAIIEWRAGSDNQSMKRQRFAHKASLIHYRGAWMDNDLGPLTPAVDPIKPPPGAPPGKPGRIRLWEGRDKVMVHLLPIDVAALQAGFDRRDSVVYLHDELKDPAQGNRIVGGYLLWNAERLSRPFTIATNGRMFLLGDFNTDPGYRVDGNPSPFPAALISDAMTHLSSEWIWSEHDDVGEGPGTAVWNSNPNARMTLNAGIMTGLTPDHQINLANRGGLHLLVRFLEIMSDMRGTTIPHSINGSLVHMWTSRISTGLYDPINYVYLPPERIHAFDPMYQSLEHMPPGTPRLVGPGLNSWEQVRR